MKKTIPARAQSPCKSADLKQIIIKNTSLFHKNKNYMLQNCFSPATVHAAIQQQHPSDHAE